MINLLPESKKKEIKLEGIWKQITAVLLLCFFFFAVFVLLLFLEKFYLEKEVKTQEAKIKRTEKEFDYTAFKNVNNEIIRINKDFTDARNFLLQRISVVDFFRKISALIPPGVNLSEVSSRELTITTNKKTKKKALNIHISGYAKDREDVFKINCHIFLYFTLDNFCLKKPLAAYQQKFHRDFQIQIGIGCSGQISLFLS